MKKSLFYIFFLSMFIVLMALGFWQVKRYEWKQGIIQKIYEQKYTPISFEAFLDKFDDQKLLYDYVSLDGQFKIVETFKLENKFRNGRPGYHLVHIVKYKDYNPLLIVDLGWVDNNNGEKFKVDYSQLEGYIFASSKPGFQLVENNYQKQTLYYMNHSEFEENFNKPFFGFYLKNTKPVDNNKKIKAHSKHIELRNTHRSYYITWFSLAFITLLFMIAFYKNNRNKRN